LVFLVKWNIDSDAVESADCNCTTNPELYVTHGKQARGKAGNDSAD